MIAKMSTRPQQSQHTSIFKIPEDSAIDSTVEMSKELTTDTKEDSSNEVDEAKDDTKDNAYDGDSEQVQNNASTPRGSRSGPEHNIVYESEEQKQEHISKIQLLRVDAISD